MSVTYRGKTYYHLIDGGKSNSAELARLTKLNEEDLELKVLGTGPAIDRINAELQQISNSFISYKIKKLSVDSIGGV
jgi:hypothetical protein